MSEKTAKELWPGYPNRYPEELAMSAEDFLEKDLCDVRIYVRKTDGLGLLFWQTGIQYSEPLTITGLAGDRPVRVSLDEISWIVVLSD